MLGWNIFIHRQKWFKRAPAKAKSRKGESVASWSADVGGVRWLDDLVAERKVVCLREGFYPGLYTAKAKDILPVIGETPLCVKTGWDWITKTEYRIHTYFGKSEKVVSTCYPDEYLIIEVWDLS